MVQKDISWNTMLLILVLFHVMQNKASCIFNKVVNVHLNCSTLGHNNDRLCYNTHIVPTGAKLNCVILLQKVPIYTRMS